MKNTFTGLRLTVPNNSIHALIAEAFTFRRQLALRCKSGEFRSQSGWYDALNAYMVTELEKLAVTVKRITYNVPSPDGQQLRAAAIKDATDTTKTLKDTFDGRSINTDNVVMPASLPTFDLPYDLSGAHADYPQPTPDFCPNDWARIFIAGVDGFVVAASNLDSAFQPSTINAMEAAQLLAMLNQLYATCQLKGGDANKADIPTGVPASEVPKTFNASGQYDSTVAAAK